LRLNLRYAHKKGVSIIFGHHLSVMSRGSRKRKRDYDSY